MLETDHLQITTNRTSETAGTDDLTRRQLEAIRDEWLQPLLMQLRHQSEEVGRLQMQVEQLREERDRLLVENGDLKASPDSATGAVAESGLASQEPASTRDSVVHALTQLTTTEGAMVAGIAIALGLWVGLGFLTLVLLG